ncbi:MAG TPA: hypothetical protein VFO39_20800 [Candidatus Sulfotelmatobacter sp.]|nr:hypothetical protein [Candidatus Sulfotelmatobacter sp.]
MIRKFVLGAALLVLGARMLQAQAPQTQQPATTPSSPSSSPQTQSSSNPQTQSPESESEEELGRRKVRPRGYEKYEFNVGAGANLSSGTSQTFVRGGGEQVGAGAARNYSKVFGFRLDFFAINLPLRTSALQLAQAPSGSNHVFALTLDPIFNIPVTKTYGGFVMVGPAFLRRSGKLDRSTVVPGTACNPFWTWWGNCEFGNLPLSNSFLSEHQNEFGYNWGGGIYRKIGGKKELYADFRQLHGSHNKVTTDVRTLTVGVRW